jgi:TonB family protein
VATLACTSDRLPGSNPVPPKLRTNVGLHPPEDFWNTHQRGSVKLEGVVEIDGHLSNIRVLNSSGPEYSKIAVESVSQWEYSPATCHGVPFRLPLVVDIAFSRDGR